LGKNSIGSITPGASTASDVLTQDLVGVVGYNGSTDGKPHGGNIYGYPGGIRNSPSGPIFAGVSPLANNSLTQSVFVGNGHSPLPNTLGTHMISGFAWAAGPAIPKPDKLVLTPNPLMLYDQKSVHTPLAAALAVTGHRVLSVPCGAGQRPDCCELARRWRGWGWLPVARRRGACGQTPAQGGRAQSVEKAV